MTKSHSGYFLWPLITLPADSRGPARQAYAKLMAPKAKKPLERLGKHAERLSTSGPGRPARRALSIYSILFIIHDFRSGIKSCLE